ncbi:MAG: ABC transporter substrate-binding protein [Lachnospiraceae bacterium]
MTSSTPFRSTPDLDLGESDFTGCYQMEYGKDRAPGNDQAFREAASYAIDYNQLATTINGEYGEVPGKGVIPPSLQRILTRTSVLWNLTLTRQPRCWMKLATKMWTATVTVELPDGSPMDLTVIPQYSSKSMDMRNRIAEVIVNSLDKVGIKNHVDNDSLSNSEVWEDTVTKGNYDISITLTTSGVASYSTAFRYFMGELRDGESSWLWEPSAMTASVIPIMQ